MLWLQGRNGAKHAIGECIQYNSVNRVVCIERRICAHVKARIIDAKLTCYVLYFRCIYNEYSQCRLPTKQCKPAHCQ